jgi:hypothetical protein
MDGKPLQGKWCPDSSGFDFFMNRLHRNYSSCDESGQPELLVLSDEVTGHLAGHPGHQVRCLPMGRRAYYGG